MPDSGPAYVVTEGAVARVVLNRPDVHNAFDETLIASLTDAVASVSENPDIRVLVFSGAGRSFCAGADLHWMGRMAGYSHEENIADIETFQRLMALIAECPKATVARVHGAAFGGGAGLAAGCDVVIAGESAKAAFSEVRLGLVPAVISPFVLQRVTPGTARMLFVTGKTLSAADALRLGLFDEVVPDAELDAAIYRTVASILKNGSQAMASAKSLLRAIAGKTPADAAGQTAACLAEARVSPEGQEGLRAFLEKRRPAWTEP